MIRPLTYRVLSRPQIMFAEMHWLWTQTCWKNNPGCKDPAHPQRSQNGCQNLPPEEPCQPVDVRLAVSRNGVDFTYASADPPRHHAHSAIPI